MAVFLQYLNPRISLQERLKQAFKDLEVKNDQQSKIAALMEPLRIKDTPTHEHSIRAGLLARRIANFMHLDETALLYAGLLHDIGKAQVRLSTLQKTEGWTEKDTKRIRPHVMNGYRLARDVFDFSAEIILWHHRFQRDGYPERIPKPLHKYCRGTRIMIPLYGRILSLTDTFDALHRVNDKFGETGGLTGEQIREKMFLFNPDQKKLLAKLYAFGILTTRIINEDDETAMDDEGPMQRYVVFIKDNNTFGWNGVRKNEYGRAESFGTQAEAIAFMGLMRATTICTTPYHVVDLLTGRIVFEEGT